MKTETYKKPYDIQYHVFSDGIDEYLTDKKEAIKMALELENEYGCVRVYEQTEWNKYDGIFEDGDCIYSAGEFPM